MSELNNNTEKKCLYNFGKNCLKYQTEYMNKNPFIYSKNPRKLVIDCIHLNNMQKCPTYRPLPENIQDRKCFDIEIKTGNPINTNDEAILNAVKNEIEKEKNNE